jgi:hypothetical protein
MSLKITSTVRNGDVYVRCSDIIASLYADLSGTDDPQVKKYITASIKSWEEYDKDIIEKARIR